MSSTTQMDGADGERPPEPTPAEKVSRREFVAAVGAGFAGVSAHRGGFRRRAEPVIPWLTQPEEAVPGLSEWFASTCL